MLQAVRRLIPSRSTETTEAPQADVEVDLDDFFMLLRNSRRRQIIRYLTREENNGLASKRELASHIAAIENNKPVSDLTAQERKRVYIGLHQAHLDKMVESGLIEYRDRDSIVEATQATYVSARLLEDVDHHFTGGGA